MSDPTTLALDDSEPLQAHKAASEPSTGLEWTGAKSQTLRGFSCCFNALNLTFNRTAVGANDFLRKPGWTDPCRGPERLFQAGRG